MYMPLIDTLGSSFTGGPSALEPSAADRRPAADPRLARSLARPGDVGAPRSSPSPGLDDLAL